MISAGALIERSASSGQINASIRFTLFSKNDCRFAGFGATRTYASRSSAGMLSSVAWLHAFPESRERRRLSGTTRTRRRACEPSMANHNLQGDAAAIAETEGVGLFDPEMTKESRRVVRGLLERERTIGDIGRPAVSLLIVCDDPTRLCQRRQVVLERSLDRRSAAMEEHERHVVADRDSMDLVVQTEAVHLRVPAFRERGRREECEKEMSFLMWSPFHARAFSQGCRVQRAFLLHGLRRPRSHREMPCSVKTSSVPPPSSLNSTVASDTEMRVSSRCISYANTSRSSGTTSKYLASYAWTVPSADRCGDAHLRPRGNRARSAMAASRRDTRTTLLRWGRPTRTRAQARPDSGGGW